MTNHCYMKAGTFGLASLIIFLDFPVDSVS